LMFNEYDFPHFSNDIYEEDQLSVDNLLPSLTSSDFNSPPTSWPLTDETFNKSSSSSIIDFSYLISM
ncbi:hypothetical protein NVV43_28395, partial [Escherichia marmotae]|nr:hypothetical protein [Escherichia marmotae]